jgi:hypothetical protein
MRPIRPSAFPCALAIACAAAGFVVTPAAANAAQPCTVSGLNPVDAAACELANILESEFVIREQGDAYARMLRAAVAEGRYAALSADAATQAMTKDLQAVAPDGHLKVFIEEPEAARRSRSGPHAAGPEMVYPKGGGNPVPVFEDAGWIAPGVGFLRLNQFSYDDTVLRQVAQFMADHAGARALIFDLRTNNGGGNEPMDLILPWLYAEPVHLLTLETSMAVERTRGSPFSGAASFRLRADSDRAAREHWVTPLADSRLRDAKVYVLTGSATNSAAEHFALALQRTGRATLVGERTRGANHFGGPVPLSGGLEAWVPIGRTYDPDTGEDWEGRGIEPDIAVPVEQALARALAELGIAPAEAAQLAAAHRPELPMVRERVGPPKSGG